MPFGPSTQYITAPVSAVILVGEKTPVLVLYGLLRMSGHYPNTTERERMEIER